MNINTTNTFYVTENVQLYQTSDMSSPASPKQGQALSLNDMTEVWFKELSGLNQNYWMFKNYDVLVKQDDNNNPVVEIDFAVYTTQVKTLYIAGDELDLSNLIVRAVYSDGSRNLLTDEDYQVDISAFNKDVAGKYNIIVSYKGYETKSFEVEVVSIYGFKVYSDDVDKTYLLGEDLSLSDLVVKAVLSDNSEITMSSSDYNVDVSNYNKNLAGIYDIIISYRDYEDIVYKVTVIDEELTYQGDIAAIEVDASYDGIDGEVGLKGLNKFKTMKSALDFLYSQDLASDVEKYIYIASGVYYEKIIITIPNLTLIGENVEDTILTYDVRSGDVKVDGTPWGTQGSASVSVKSSAYNFMAKNITFENSFDYFEAVSQGLSSDLQAVAIVIEADMTIFYNCRFLGKQDTLYAKSGRQYYYNSYIEGIVDFIFGNAGPAYFENSVIKSLARSTGVITAQKGTGNNGIVEFGYVFYNNEFIKEDGTPANSVHLGRPWGQDAAVAFINNKMDDHINVVGWTDMSGNTPEKANFKEYGSVDLEGNPITRNEEIYRGEILTQEEAARYINKDNVFAKVNGTESFNNDWDYASDFASLEDIEF